jgi:hypothetical protein
LETALKRATRSLMTKATRKMEMVLKRKGMLTRTLRSGMRPRARSLTTMETRDSWALGLARRLFL